MLMIALHGDTHMLTFVSLIKKGNMFNQHSQFYLLNLTYSNKIPILERAFTDGGIITIAAACDRSFFS
jgi:hypothetical protein